MASPWSKVKRRIGAAIQVRAERAVEAQLRGVLTTVHAINEQLKVVVESVASWEARSDSAISEFGRSLDHLRLEAAEFRSSMASETSRVNSLVEAQIEVQSAFESVYRAISTQEGLRKTLESRIRAVPFGSGSDDWTIEVEGRRTIGFNGPRTGPGHSLVEAWRPAENDLIESLRSLLKWLPKNGVAIDLGAGRGEMVSLLIGNGLLAHGVDSDEEMVRVASAAGLRVELSTVDEALAKCESNSVDAFTAVHIVEHADADEVRRWFANIHRALKPGGVLVVETPNPHAIDAFKAFWLDVTHVRPYYPEALVVEVARSGFSQAFIDVPGGSLHSEDALATAGSYVLIARK